MKTRARWGFTLAEVLIAVSVVAILAAVALPQYQKTIERGYWRGAQDVLQAVYSGEQVYWTANNKYYDPAAKGDWITIYMDNPNLGSNMPVTFSVTSADGFKNQFLWTATRDAKRSMTIDQTKTLNTNNWQQP